MKERLGLIITIVVVAVLVVAFLISLRFHSPIKDRRHLPRQPRGLDVNAGYPHYVEPTEPQALSEQSKHPR